MWLIYYIIAINIVGVFIMAWDKMKARAGAWRISENNLLLIALVGGSVGIYLGLKVFRHKSRHYKFSVGVPIIFLIQAGIVVWLFYQVRV
ncbi:MAG: membrane protein [Peptococcaceae bacterium BRH_c4b]|nr:MAG: membrane protein [Peptococcaceae bacterium BRH_c4b]